MKLDIGSGNLKYKDSHIFLKQKDIIHLDLKKKSFHLEVNATVYALPFKDDTFETVYLRHVLEHLEDPLLALKEIKRVCKYMLIIQVPNASYFKFKSSTSTNEHIFSWNFYTLNNLLHKVFDFVDIYSTKRYNKKRGYFKKMIFAIACLFLQDNELTAFCCKTPSKLLEKFDARTNDLDKYTEIPVEV